LDVAEEPAAAGGDAAVVARSAATGLPAGGRDGAERGPAAGFEPPSAIGRNRLGSVSLFNAPFSQAETRTSQSGTMP